MRLKPSVRRDKHFLAIISQRKECDRAPAAAHTGCPQRRGARGHAVPWPGCSEMPGPCRNELQDCVLRRQARAGHQRTTTATRRGAASTRRRLEPPNRGIGSVLGSGEQQTRGGSPPSCHTERRPPSASKETQIRFLGKQKAKVPRVRTTLEMPSEAAGPSFPLHAVPGSCLSPLPRLSSSLKERMSQRTADAADNSTRLGMSASLQNKDS